MQVGSARPDDAAVDNIAVLIPMNCWAFTIKSEKQDELNAA